jgi:hypothetical protein
MITTTPTPLTVTQKCAIWCVESAQPFLAFEDTRLKSILHPRVLKNLPHQKLLLKAIHKIYTTVQENLKSNLKVSHPSLLNLCSSYVFSSSFNLQKHFGVMHIGVDAWQLPNGLNILGTVIY